MKIPPIVLSAYNAARPDLTDHPNAESDWYRALREKAGIRGVELASKGATLHPRGVSHLADLVDPSWTNTVGGMGCTLDGVAADPEYGLASTSSRGRTAALADIDSLRRDTLALRAILGQHCVFAVVLHSAPRASVGSAEMFEASLLEIVGADWGAMSFLIEHTDTLVADHEPQKGWLPLDAEIHAARNVREKTGADVRVLLNWGRAAIEARSADGAADLMRRAADSGLLGAVALSGASGAVSARGGSWADIHLGLSTDEPDSLLTPELAVATLDAAPSDIAFVGVKVGAPLDSGTDPAERLRYADSVLDVVRTSFDRLDVPPRHAQS